MENQTKTRVAGMILEELSVRDIKEELMDLKRDLECSDDDMEREMLKQQIYTIQHYLKTNIERK